MFINVSFTDLAFIRNAGALIGVSEFTTRAPLHNPITFLI